jgi:intergrase/recombinase
MYIIHLVTAKGKNMQKLIKQRESLLAKIMAGGEFIKGSITCVCGTCGRSRCICTTKTASKAYRLTYKDGRQKTQIVYIPRNRLQEMKRLIVNYARVRALVQQLVITNIAIFKKGGLPEH